VIKRRKEPLFDVYLTRAGTRFSMAVSARRPRPRALPLGCADAAGASRRFADLESAPQHRDAVRRGDRAEALLHLMASAKLLWETLWRPIPSPLTAGRLLLALDDSIKSEGGTAYLRLSTHLRSCREDEPDALAVGADHRHAGVAAGRTPAQVRPASLQCRRIERAHAPAGALLYPACLSRDARDPRRRSGGDAQDAALPGARRLGLRANFGRTPCGSLRSGMREL